MDTAPNYRFDRFVLNIGRGCLQDGHVDLELRPKSFAVLCLLVQRAGRLVSKDQIVEAVWPDVIASDDAVAHCIRDIRKVLNGQADQFIRTVPRRGYMFVAEVMFQLAYENAAANSDEPARDVGETPSSEPPLQFEENYRARLRQRYGKDAQYFVPLSAVTNDSTPVDWAQERRSAGRCRARPEYSEWVRSGEEIECIKLESLQEAVARYPCIILLGDPGCGKTSTLENLAYEYAGDDDWLPLLLDLGGLHPSDSLEDFILRNWASALDGKPFSAKDPSAALQRALDAGRLLFLFDALNEMPIDRYREHCQNLRRFIDHWSPLGNRVVVSCRVLDYGDELSGLQRIEIQPLSDEKIQQLIQNELLENWQAMWTALTQSTDQSRSLLEIARNPYMLTVMIDVFVAKGELTENRSELMRRLVGILMGWAGAKSPAGIAVNAELQSAALSIMAFEMQRRSGFGTASMIEDVKAVIPGRIEVSPGWPAQPCQPDQLLSFAASAKIIEISADRRTVRFYHQLLQEFFAAQHMLRLDPVQSSDLWRWPWREDEMPRWVRPENNFEPLPPPPSTGWEETTVLAAGLTQSGADGFIQAVCRINPVLAARCVLDGHAKIEPAVRRHLIDALLSAVADANVALRARIAAGDVLGRLGDPRSPEMVHIPSGNFTMGDGPERHEVWLNDYEIGRYPVTNAEYRPFVEAGGYAERSHWTDAGWQEVGGRREEPRFWQNSRFNRPNQPVIGLSWYECVAYCRWLAEQTGRAYRLPTEAEWEKAARGQDARLYPWGDRFDASRLNAREGDQKVYCSTPVGAYPAGVSPYGLFDCAGNGWEWCATRWKKSFPYDGGEDEWTEIYLEGRTLRALRGGSWNYEAELAQCAHRFRFEPLGWNDRGGFRTACGAAR